MATTFVADIHTLEDALEQAAAPYTPGRLPVWEEDWKMTVSAPWRCVMRFTTVTLPERSPIRALSRGRRS